MALEGALLTVRAGGTPMSEISSTVLQIFLLRTILAHLLMTSSGIRGSLSRLLREKLTSGVDEMLVKLYRRERFIAASSEMESA
ncbi:hypothetical protein CDL15_Pgr015137 [Punica granatum]|uniref:Uncharacterized protein n=1 Tax=Punica granatum TaxID=22663 RepID=A0A218VZI5_PUNGR|nr:hypothetical protein CDL15_Pgr015137 [Punica granatum]